MTDRDRHDPDDQDDTDGTGEAGDRDTPEDVDAETDGGSDTDTDTDSTENDADTEGPTPAEERDLYANRELHEATETDPGASIDIDAGATGDARSEDGVHTLGDASSDDALDADEAVAAQEPAPDADPAESVGGRIRDAIQNHPLSHPLVFSIAEMEYGFTPPDHVCELYGAVYRALSTSEKHSTAPKALARLMPREHAKSESGSVVTPTWLALKDPNARILIMSETEGQAKGKLRECADYLEMLAPKYGRAIDTSNKTELTMKRDAVHNEPTIKAAGFGSGVTGGHYDLIIFDDLVSWKTQRTPSRRDKVKKQFNDYLKLGSQGQSTYLVLGTRKQRDDLYAELISAPGWDARVRPALNDWSIVENKEYDVLTTDREGNVRQYPAKDLGTIDTVNETVTDVEPHRQVNVLWPERWPLKALLLDLVRDYGREHGTAVWKREMMNDAAALEGQILTAEMLTFAKATDGAYALTGPSAPDSLVWYAGLDPAIEDDPEKAAANDTDYWALAILAKDASNGRVFLVDVVRKRGLSLTGGIEWTASQLAKYPSVRKCLVESQQAQRWFVQQGKEEGLPLKRSNSTGAKEQRIIDMSARFESARVQIAPYATEGDAGTQTAVGTLSDRWESFVREFVGFPSAQHDDRLDATEIALRNLSEGKAKRRRPNVRQPYMRSPSSDASRRPSSSGQYHASAANSTSSDDSDLTGRPNRRNA